MTFGKTLIHKLICLKYLSIHFVLTVAVFGCINPISTYSCVKKWLTQVPGPQTHESYEALIMFLQASFCQLGVIRCK